MHRFFIYIFLVIFVLTFSHNVTYSKTVLKGGISTVIEKGQELKVNLSTPINFYYSQTGDKVAAFTSEDIPVGDFYIPKGSRVEGIITRINKPKSFGLNGSFEIDFNEIVTPEDIHIPIYASVSTDISKGEEKVARILTYDAALIAYGSIHGAIGSLQYGGLPLALASHGISVLAGAGVGAGAGIVGSIFRKGSIPIAISGIPTKVMLKSNLSVFGELPKIKESIEEIQEARNKKQEAGEEEYKGFRFFPILKESEIELVINDMEKKHSEVYGNYIVLEFKLKNSSNKTVSLSNLILVNGPLGVKLHADLLLSGNEALKHVGPFDEINASLAFLVNDREEDYYLALIDPLDRSEVIKVPLKSIGN